MTAPQTSATLSKRQLKILANDNIKCAEAANLVYVTDKEPGIIRIKKGKGFAYIENGCPVTNEDVLTRIKNLVVPPAWTEVWICKLPNGHLQATGVDIKKRKQYRYHPLWNALRAQTKFFHLWEFGQALPGIRAKLNDDLNLKGLPQRKVLATVIALMDHTGIRIGSDIYEKLNGSYGLTTLQNKHVAISGTETIFSFKGKKGVYHDIKLKSRKLTQIVQQCRDIPGKELFQYIDENGHRHPIDSGMVNEYIREISGQNFTSKDFRTWVGTVCAFETFAKTGNPENEADAKKKIIEVVDTVAKRLGNTRAVCRKYYIHPAVIDHYTNGGHAKLAPQPSPASKEQLNQTEQTLMTLLSKTNKTATRLELYPAA